MSSVSRDLAVNQARTKLVGLDYFETRYMSSAQGRFTSPDPLPWLHWQRAGDEDRARFQDFISDPQNLNLYAYTRNNPLRFTDPTGMYYCTGDDAQCAKLKQAYGEAQAALKSEYLTKDQKAAIQRVLTFLGKPGDVNGVVVKFATVDKTNPGGTTFDPQFKTTTITFDPKITKGYSTEDFSEMFIHEGRHGIDEAGWGRNPSTGSEMWTTERHAYGVQSYIPMGLGVGSGWGLWDPSWKGTPQAEINRQRAIERNAGESVKADCGPAGCKK
jgi:RHS repeat-associated protein